MRSFFLCLFIPFLLFSAYEPSSELVEEMLQKRINYEKNPTSNKSCFDLAMVYAYTGAMEEGFAILKKVDPDYAQQVLLESQLTLKKNSELWRPYFRQAFAYYFLERSDDAVASFKNVIKNDEGNVWAMLFIAFIRGEQGDLDEALKWTKRANKIEPDAAAGHFMLGEIYRRKHRYILATSHFIKCMHFRTLERNFRANLK